MKRAVAAVVLVIAVLVPAPEAGAEEVPGPIRFVPETPEASIRLDAKFAERPDLCPARQPRNLHAAYPGILEVGRRSDGRLYLVTELDFPRYLKGIAEVPRDWPVDALKAQVVGARTYAIGHMNPSTAIARELRYNLCATDACQVYRGLVVERGAWGDRWSQAVDETAGEILEHNRRPASTFYFSTSNGRTYSNADAFGGSPLPYLVPVTEEDDVQSPVSSWSVRIPLSDLAETLRRAGSWGSGPIEEVVQEGETVRLSGGGQSGSLSVEQFRNRLNAQAVCLVPKRYPTAGANGRPLPQVVPSKWMTVRRDGSDALIEGRGWGHGVGMVQWGLKGKAERGITYQDMLAFYYGGLRPVERAEPGAIRIGLAMDIEEIRVELRGPVRVEGAAAPRGAILMRGGAVISVGPGEPIPPLLEVREVSSVPQPAPGAPLMISLELSAPANVILAYRGPAEGRTNPEPRDRGIQTLALDASALPPGDYEIRVEAADGVDQVASEPVLVTVAAPTPSPSPSPSPTVRAFPSPEPGPQGMFLVWRGMAIGLFLLATLLGAALWARRRSRRTAR